MTSSGCMVPCRSSALLMSSLASRAGALMAADRDPIDLADPELVAGGRGGALPGRRLGLTAPERINGQAEPTVGEVLHARQHPPIDLPGGHVVAPQLSMDRRGSASTRCASELFGNSRSWAMLLVSAVSDALANGSLPAAR